MTFAVRCGDKTKFIVTNAFVVAVGANNPLPQPERPSIKLTGSFEGALRQLSPPSLELFAARPLCVCPARR